MEGSADYAHPPHPVPAYSLSMPCSPVLYRATGGRSRNIPTPGRTPNPGLSPGMVPIRAHTAPSSPVTQRCARKQDISTLTSPGRQNGCQNGAQNGCRQQLKCQNNIKGGPPIRLQNGLQNQLQLPQNDSQQQLQHQHHCQQQPSLQITKQRSLEELKSTVQTVASSMEHGAQDVRHLGQKMVAATELMSDSVEENAQALNLLAEVVDKLQGLIVASKPPESSSPRRPKRQTPPPPPPRTSSISPKPKPKTPIHHCHHLSSSSPSPSSHTSSSSSSSLASYGNNLTTPGNSSSSPRMNGGCKKKVVVSSATQRTGGSNSGTSGKVLLNNGTVYGAQMENHKDHNAMGCLSAKKKKKKKKK